MNATANNFVKYDAGHYLETCIEIVFMGCIFP